MCRFSFLNKSRRTVHVPVLYAVRPTARAVGDRQIRIDNRGAIARARYTAGTYVVLYLALQSRYARNDAASKLRGPKRPER